MNQRNPRERLPTSLCLCFGVGTVGTSISLNLVAVYFPTLMSTVLGVSPGIAGALLMGSKLYDAFADLAIGNASDNARFRSGRRRPFLLAGAIVTFIALLAIFFVPALPKSALIGYMVVTLVLHATGYSLFNVPYLAMPAEMTQSYEGRLRLISFRTAFISLGQLLSLAATAALIEAGGGGIAGYRLMAGVMASIALFGMLTAFFGTRGARSVARGPDKHKLRPKDVLTLLDNKPLTFLLSAKLCQYIAFGIIQPANLLFLLNVLRTGYEGMINMMVVQNLAVFLSMPLWVRAGKVFGKRRCYLAANAILIPVSISWFFADPGLPMWEIWLRAAIWGFGSGGALLMSTSMLPDAMEYDRLISGRSREGLISSIYSVNEKLGFALGAAAMGVGLSMAGYVATTGGAIIDQSSATILTLYAIKAFVPTAILVLGMVLIWFYRLDADKLRAAREATPPG